MIRFDSIRLRGLTDITLPIFGIKPTDPYQVTAADGLGPPEQNVLIAENHAPGGRFISRRSQGRQIVIRCGLNPDYSVGQTVGDLRYSLYGLLSPSTDPKNQSIQVQLLRLNVPIAQVVGYVRRIEIVPFDRKPQAQITIDCLSPYLEEPEDKLVFPPTNLTTWEIDNQGLAPTGIDFKVKFQAAVQNFDISVVGGDSMSFSYSGGFLVNDELQVNTNEAYRFVGLLRGGTYVRYLELLSPTSQWIILHGGTHQIQTSNPSDFDWVEFKYRQRYWGI